MDYIDQIGQYWQRTVQQTKYDYDFSIDIIKQNISRLTNQLWKLIPMRENEENWSKQLNLVTLEISGLNEIFISVNFLQLLSKLEGLQIKDTSFEDYRRTVFESISLLQELGHEIEK